MASEPYVDKSELVAKLLDKWPLGTNTIPRKQKAPAREPRPRDKPSKNLVEQPASINQPIAN